MAALATLNVLRREGTYDRLFETGRQLMDSLERLLKEAEIPAQVAGVPPMFDVFFTDAEITDYRSTLASDKAMKSRFNQLLRERGVFKGDTKLYVSTAHTQEDVTHTINAFASAIDELKG